MKSLSHATLLAALGLVAVVGLIVLAATGHPIPDVLPALALASLSALAGLAIPTGTGGAALVAADLPSTPAPAPDPAPAPAAAPSLAEASAALVRSGYGRPVE